MEETNILGENPTPIRHMGEEVLRAPLRTGAHVNFHTQSFAPSGARTIKYPRRPASDLCGRFSACGRGSAHCRGWQLDIPCGSGAESIDLAANLSTSPCITCADLIGSGTDRAGYSYGRRSYALARPDELGTSWSCSSPSMVTEVRTSEAGEFTAVVPTLMPSPSKFRTS